MNTVWIHPQSQRLKSLLRDFEAPGVWDVVSAPIVEVDYGRVLPALDHLKFSGRLHRTSVG